jgi:hypothetical protein
MTFIKYSDLLSLVVSVLGVLASIVALYFFSRKLRYQTRVETSVRGTSRGSFWLSRALLGVFIFIQLAMLIYYAWWKW